MSRNVRTATGRVTAGAIQHTVARGYGKLPEMTKLPLPRSTSETPLEVGFVGLGVMGRPMATRITQAGFPLTVHSRSATAVAQLVAAGARAAASPADVAARTDVVIVMVPDAPDLEAVLDGAQGILAEAHDGLVVAAMGTHASACQAVRRKRRHLARRPVSGGEVGAIEGSLSIMVGGDAAAFGRARPVGNHRPRPPVSSVDQSD